MEFTLIVAKQVIIMFLLILIGFVLFRIKMIDRHTVSQMTDILIYLVAPAIIFSSFQLERNMELIKIMFLTFLLSIISFLVPIVSSYLLIRGKNNAHASVERFGISYPNNGFMGIPLVQAVFGSSGVLYAAIHICTGNLLIWTHGIGLMLKERSANQDQEKLKLPLSQLLLSPPLIGFIAGFLFFLFQVPLPEPVKQTIDYIGSLNTPLAMIIVGANLAQTGILSAFRKPRLYWVTFCCNLAAPLLVLLLLFWLPVPEELLISVILLTACPCAAMAIIFAEKYGGGGEYATKMFTLSSLSTLLTLPLMMLIISLMVG